MTEITSGEDIYVQATAVLDAVLAAADCNAAISDVRDLIEPFFSGPRVASAGVVALNGVALQRLVEQVGAPIIPVLVTDDGEDDAPTDPRDRANVASVRIFVMVARGEHDDALALAYAAADSPVDLILLYQASVHFLRHLWDDAPKPA